MNDDGTSEQGDDDLDDDDDGHGAEKTSLEAIKPIVPILQEAFLFVIRTAISVSVGQAEGKALRDVAVNLFRQSQNDGSPGRGHRIRYYALYVRQAGYSQPTHRASSTSTLI